MLFSSLPFLFCFFPLFFVIYFAFKGRAARNVVLLLFSLIFYAWGEPLFILLMLFSITCDYFLGMGIGKAHEANNPKRAKTLMLVSLVANLIIIGSFKYLDFFIMSVNGIAGTGIRLPGLPLPIGISFYTFQTISYIIDVYRKKVPAQKNPLFLGAYMFSFPQLIAGPIVRYETIQDEIAGRRENLADFTSGLRRFICGLAKKVLIANNVALLTDSVLKLGGAEYGASGAWLAMVCYTLQIYFDFSGYSDMAIGMGRMMGFHYLENFNYPYIAKSVSDFWRRWHISLSSFFRDYVYIPLGGNRVSVPRWVLNIMVVWGLTGLWHGASWNFIIWGLYFGLLLILERFALQKALDKLPVLRNVYTLFAVIMGWVIFRSESVPQMREIISSMFGANGLGSLTELIEFNDVQLPQLIAMVIGIACAFPISRRVKKLFELKPAGQYLIDFSALAALAFCVFSLASGSYNPFIYFRF